MIYEQNMEIDVSWSDVNALRKARASSEAISVSKYSSKPTQLMDHVK